MTYQTVSFVMSSYNNSVCISSESASTKGINADIFRFLLTFWGFLQTLSLRCRSLMIRYRSKTRRYCNWVTKRYAIVREWQNVTQLPVGYLAFLKNRWLFWLSPPNAPERPRTPPDATQRLRIAASRCHSLPLAANGYESQLFAPFIKSY